MSDRTSRFGIRPRSVAVVAALGAAIVGLTLSPAGANSSAPPTTTPDIIIGGGGGFYYSWDKLSNISSADLTSWSGTLGKPTLVGQYLDWDGSPVLNTTTIGVMHNAGIKVILIMDNDEVYGNGTADANLAAQQAVALRAPANGTVAIYRDVEPSDSPSSTYLNAWYNELLVKGFIPGFYVNPLSSHPFAGDFCGSNSATISGSYLWSQQPLQTQSPTYPASFKSSALPKTWEPDYPYCTIGNTVSAWQYQIFNGTTSPVDVDADAIAGAW